MRAKKYETAKQLEAKIEEYFKKIKTFEIDREIPSISGMLLTLGMTRQGLQHYKKLPEFSDVIEFALLQISTLIEQGMLHGNYAAAPSIFYLKSAFGWREPKRLEEGEVSSCTNQ